MTDTPSGPRFWLEKPMAKLSADEWESLCDGCGKCCTNTLEDEETGEYFTTCVACRLFDNDTAQCGDYARRKVLVPECIRISPRNIHKMDFLPETCAYRLVWRRKDLPRWHHLVCGDREAVHREGHSVRGRTINEDTVIAAGGTLEDHLVDWSDTGKVT